MWPANAYAVSTALEVRPKRELEYASICGSSAKDAVRPRGTDPLALSPVVTVKQRLVASLRHRFRTSTPSSQASWPRRRARPDVSNARAAVYDRKSRPPNSACRSADEDRSPQRSLRRPGCRSRREQPRPAFTRDAIHGSARVAAEDERQSNDGRRQRRSTAPTNDGQNAIVPERPTSLPDVQTRFE